MKIALRFSPSPAEDVVKYTLYGMKAIDGVALDKITAEFAVDFGKPEVDLEGFCQVVLNDVPGLSSLDGIYNCGISATDEAGNESQMLTEGFTGVNVDFVSPGPPTSGSVLFF